MSARVATLLMLLTGLAGCSSLTAAENSGGQYNSSFGAAGSALAGNEGKSAISNLLNKDFARGLESSDHRAIAEAQSQALRTDGVGAAIGWKNEKTGRSGTVRPGPVYHVNDTTCREFVHEMALGGQTVKSRGTAYQSENGNWQTVS